MNRNFGKLESNTLKYAPSVLNGETGLITRPTASDYIAAGWKAVDASQPDEAAEEGYHYEPDGWAESSTTIWRTWKKVADAPVYRKFSKLKIYGAIVSLPDANGTSAWDVVKAWLEAKTIEGINGWMAFQLAQEISEDHALFASLAKEARQLLGLSDEQFETLLDACILE